jgi:hypothetical protein
VLTPRIGKNGYPAVQLYGRSVYVHTLVLETFVSPRPSPEMEGCHENNIKTDCRLGNLRWDTTSGNNGDKVRHGTAQRGERHGGHVLTIADVRAIRASDESSRALSERYHVHPVTIRDAQRGRTWSWLVK